MDTVPNSNMMGQQGIESGPATHLSEKQQQMQMRDEDLVNPTTNTQPLEVYMYYAAIEREREDADTRPVPDSPWTVMIKVLTGRRSAINHADTPNLDAPLPKVHRVSNEAEPVPEGMLESSAHVTEKGRKASDGATMIGPESATVQSAAVNERNLAYRALRTASWQAVFYLITTDILGFSSAPQAFSQLGYGPGVLVYTFFYLLAFGAGQVIWRMYMVMDSERFPVKCYADLGERTFGRAVRHGFNILQSFQIIFNVAILLIGEGRKLSSIIEYKFCYLALTIFFMLVGLIAGQIRSLRGFSWFTNINIWLNLLLMVLTMIGIGLFDPIPSQSGHVDLSEPISRTGWVPDYTRGWYQQVSGVQLAVFAYGGAMIFTEFMAEMRRPRDFWKAAFGAQLFCYLMYMFFGLFVYSFQGQYTGIIPSLNFANRALSLATNIIGLITTVVASVLYGNIGVKVLYENLLKPYLRAPEMNTKRGRVVWSIAVCGYWIIAWVLGSAIPNITALVTLIGAACILQFTYTFPPLLLVGHWMQRDAIKGDKTWEPGMAPGSTRVDTWRDASRWKRGFKPYWYIKLFLILLVLSALALCGLGIYSGVEEAIAAYRAKTVTAFSCRAPNQP